MATMTKRASPVKVTLPASPWFVASPASDEALGAPSMIRETRFKIKQPGFGSRHIHDDAPFCLWDAEKCEYRDLLLHESQWIQERYNAHQILVELPDIFIQTSSPPDPLPLTLAAAVVRFYPLDLNLHTTIPQGRFFPYGTAKKEDILGFQIPRFVIPTEFQCQQIIQKLQEEISIRSIHFLPPIIIVELNADDEKVYGTRSLPAKAGGLNIMYHHSAEPFWKGQSQLSFARITTPPRHVRDESDYLQQSPFQISPGVCLSSAASAGNQQYHSLWQMTTAGLMIQRGPERCLTVANDGFKSSHEVFHPRPSGRRIGNIVHRWPAWDLAFVAIDPSISFNNARYFSAPSPARLVTPNDLLAGDWFEIDAISTGRVDMMARGRSYHHQAPEASQGSLPIQYVEWDISMLYSVFGALGGSVQDGVCGAPAVDEEGRVAGFFRIVDGSGLWASTASLGFLIHQGWSIV